MSSSFSSSMVPPPTTNVSSSSSSSSSTNRNVLLNYNDQDGTTTYNYDAIRQMMMMDEDDVNDNKNNNNKNNDTTTSNDWNDTTHMKSSNTSNSNSNNNHNHITIRHVTVNQRALIDKILARYATSYSIYRELIQNSNDAMATIVKLHFITTTTDSTSTSSTSSTTNEKQSQSQSQYVKQVYYENNGLPFEIQDWYRLTKIAEGNPNPNKIGAFGVGAYTMFSICNNPMIISNEQALIFCWKNDALYTKHIHLPKLITKQQQTKQQQQQQQSNNNNNNNNVEQQYTTTFCLPSRDVYILPNLYDLGTFLMSTLTFTNHLHTIHVYVNHTLQYTIHKSIIIIPTGNGEDTTMPTTPTTTTIPLPSKPKSSSSSTAIITDMLSKSSLLASSSALLFNYTKSKHRNSNSNSSSSTTTTVSPPPPSSSLSTTTTTTTTSNELLPKHLQYNNDNNSSNNVQLSTDLFTIQNIQAQTVQFTVTVYSNNNNDCNSKSNSNSSSSTNTATTSLTSSSSSYTVYTKCYSTIVSTHISSDIVQKMERITKKLPPSTLPIHFIVPTYYYDNNNNNTKKNGLVTTNTNSKEYKMARYIAKSILPKNNNTTTGGRIFIGFRTSQTTGLQHIHISAPFIPTVEREAIDLVDPIIAYYNTQLLYCCGIVLRYILEYTMFTITNNTNQQQDEQNDNEVVDSDDDDDDYHNEDTDNDNMDSTTLGTSTKTKTSSGSLFGLAKYMARGVTKQITSSVVKSVNMIVESTTSTTSNNKEQQLLLYPPDIRPISSIERLAITIMKSYCPIQPSTPDATVGTIIAQGFVSCLPMNVLPPVITSSIITDAMNTNINNTHDIIVVSGENAKLPYYGIERFVTKNVVRNKIYNEIETFHTIVAQCTKLQYNDLYEYIQSNILPSTKIMIQLIQWWTKFCYVEKMDRSTIQIRGLQLKESIRYSNIDNDRGGKNNNNDTTQQLSQYFFYIDRNTPYFTKQHQYQHQGVYYENVPLPETVLPRPIQESIGLDVLMNETIHDIWFNPMPMEIYVDYISRHDCMNLGNPEDDMLRINILTILCREYMRRNSDERIVFGGLCHSLLSTRRCIPFDSDIPTQYTADCPIDLYLNNAELSSFTTLGSFHKVSNILQHHPDMNDEFLVVLGVRKSVSIDFLFTHLDKLCWNSNPKPLIEYLQKNSNTLSKTDWEKLSTTKYLPAAITNDTNISNSATTYAPFELYLPNDKLQKLPFVKLLAWPESTTIHEKSETGIFLRQLGMKVAPALIEVLSYLNGNDLSEDQLLDGLDFLCDRLVPHGIYYSQYNNMHYNEKKKYRIVPCVAHDIIALPQSSQLQEQQQTKAVTSTQPVLLQQRQSPCFCFSDSGCAIMGFPVIDPKLGKKGLIYGTLLQCDKEPTADYLLNQLKHLVALAKDRVKTTDMKVQGPRIIASFQEIFKYLSQRSSELNYSSLQALGRDAFIPCMDNNVLVWYRPNDVFFRRATKTSDKDDNNETITEELFHVIDFNPFLAAAGVKDEATTADLFLRMLASPQEVLNTLGSEKKYRALLRRVAADPPFQISRPPANIKNSPFLLAYQVKASTDEGQDFSVSSSVNDRIVHQLAKADDIYIIDNSNYGRMFTVHRAPPESDLEDFYIRLGAHYISKSVDRRFEVVGSPKSDTAITMALRERLHERGPLLVSPNITSRPLVANASSVLNDKMLEFYEAPNLLAVYTLGKVSRRTTTTCFSRPNRQKNTIYITPNFDLFDVGHAIGDLILKRCMLEDAFFISSLLDTPLEQLRARGFPVDRIVKSEPLVPDVVQNETKPSPISATIAKFPETKTPHSVNTGGNIPTPVSTSSVTNQKESLQSSADDERLSNNTDQSNSTKSSAAVASTTPPTSMTGTKADILMQMFPDADPSFIRAALGSNPSVDDVKELADTMANGHYPKKKTESNSNDDDGTGASSNDSVPLTDASIKKKSLRQRLGGALSGKRRPAASESNFTPPIPPSLIDQESFSGGKGDVSDTTSATSSNLNTTMQKHTEKRGPVSPAEDVRSQNALEQMLQQSVSKSNRVTKNHIDAPETTLTSIPSELDRGESCEVIPGHSLKPFDANLKGILVFSSKEFKSSEAFLSDNGTSLQCFGVVLERLCISVFTLSLSSIAIYHDPAGVSIAFNRNKALHFNFRFFHGLHFLTGKYRTSECYSYWFVTICHELAHHFVSGHTKEHGFYTENFNQLYLPKLIAMLRDHNIS